MADNDKQTATTGLEGVLDRIRVIRRDLPPTAGRIADFVLNNASDVVHMSVTEVAEGAGASEGSVVGFCQLLGARGFQQIKIALARDLVQPVQFIHEDLTPADDIGTVVDKIFQSDLQALTDTQKALDRNEMARAVATIRKAKRVEVFGIGSAAPIAEDTNYRLLRIGIMSRVSVDSHVQAITASLADKDVAVITISHSGSTTETLAATRLAKEAGATTIAVTNFGKSPLLAYTDIVLNTLARETQFRTEAMTSRIAQLAIIDTLIACLALADYERAVSTIGSTFEVLSTKRL
ncbi:RpiR family transcriptional regulator [Youhaiella tibetensis]|uniref:MurR/RpiR family transcriptional regulator n=1 Tax=Paradevosia tibetensis TaxID=1447062 RepID=A0A5B9DMU4_9HYPH|nr:MurR/RpiR family transcriptional regulator [Youhaiella tibetensis]QEE20154.1 MurR/RpiR family transcriptional regulator [Youhaiella tibetensis]GGF26659.1 RpiR family transcriptional regulator [Youhaiella tibetensis]